MRVPERLLSFSLSVALLTAFSLPAAEAQGEPAVPPEEIIEQYEKAQAAAKNQRIERAVEENETGTDPRSFALQWSPYCRYTELENGLIQQELVAFSRTVCSQKSMAATLGRSSKSGISALP